MILNFLSNCYKVKYLSIISLVIINLSVAKNDELLREYRVLMYAPSGWHESTGVELQTVETILSQYRERLEDSLGVPVIHVTEEGYEFEQNDIVVQTGAWGSEMGNQFPSRSIVHPIFWDWIAPKYTYLRYLSKHNVPVLPAYHYHDGVVKDLKTNGAIDIGSVLENIEGKIVIKKCGVAGGGSGVYLLGRKDAYDFIGGLNNTHGALIQRDYSHSFSKGEYKVAINTRTGEFLGVRHIFPGKEFGTYIPAKEMPLPMRKAALLASRAVLQFASENGVLPPPILRVDLVRLDDDKYVVNELEIADFVSWQWGKACINDCSVDNRVVEILRQSVLDTAIWHESNKCVSSEK